MTGGPIAPKGTICPLHRKDVSRVCHTCAWYTRIQGVNPQTGEHLDKWLCAITAQVLAVLDVGKAATAGAATTQELRNDMKRERGQQTRLLATQLLPNNNGRLLIQGNDDERHG